MLSYDDLNMVTNLEDADPRVRETVDALSNLLSMPVIALYRQVTKSVPAPTNRNKNATKTVIVAPNDYTIRVLSPKGCPLGDSNLTLNSSFGPLVCGGGSGLFMMNVFSEKWYPIRKQLEEKFDSPEYKEEDNIEF